MNRIKTAVAIARIITLRMIDLRRPAEDPDALDESTVLESCVGSAIDDIAPEGNINHDTGAAQPRTTR